MRYLLIILSLINITIFLSGCGEAPMGWEGALISDETTPNSDNDEEQDDEEQDDEEQDDEEQDDEIPPPPDTKLFFTTVSSINQTLQSDCDNLDINCDDYIYTIESQSGFCYDPNNETVSNSEMNLILDYNWATCIYDILWTEPSLSSNTAIGTVIYDYTCNNYSFYQEYPYEFRFNSDFTNATFHAYIDSAWNENGWVFTTNSTCE